MSDFINTIDVLGDEAVIDSIIDRTIIEFKDDKIKEIGQYALYNCTALTELNLPNAEKLDIYSCMNCTSLVSVSIPNVTKLWGNNFRGCSALKNVYAPELVNVGHIQYNTVSFDTFGSCTALEKIELPKAETIYVSAFVRCSNLVKADLPSAIKIENQAFAYCWKLEALILRNENAICGLGATNSLMSTNIASGKGYIYVPRALIEDYKIATNWSTYADQFRALEDYTVDGTTTGELDEIKI